MAAIFRPSANVWMRAALLAVPLLVGAGLVAWIVGQRTDWKRGTDATIGQPVPFSHQHHVAGLGIDCLMCHQNVEVSANAGLPPTHTCMTCHSQIWTNAAVLAPVRDSLASGTPIEWNRINRLPDYVYFNHSIHVAKGVGCASCHGNVAEMPLMYKAASMTMDWCLSCHRNPGPNLRPADLIYDPAWKRGPDTPSVEALLAQYHIGGRNLTECSICHR